ncbi:hypothetical protein CN514_04945 [Bacillus sp. AFS001701]|uniref:dockerin type I domain-containing protein n=1 Tax=Bacillus sp. AFS001701 TaxID=2033480 RepID=UPI000BF3E24B|nr:dockerin type I domain-containing protein [Bacillus sp. AFS001701]PET74943.1 hypothetical protein CN514_04945 [Bacillus sp. AFS001701]
MVRLKGPYGGYYTASSDTIVSATAGYVNKDIVIDVTDALAIQTYWGTNKRSADINFEETADAKDLALFKRII